MTKTRFQMLLSEKQVKQLDKLAEVRDESKVSLIRQALNSYLKQPEQIEDIK